MRRRLALLIAAAAALVLVGLMVRWLMVPTCGINQATFHRITAGISREDVVALIGVGPGDYTTGDVRFVKRHQYWGRPFDDDEWAIGGEARGSRVGDRRFIAWRLVTGDDGDVTAIEADSDRGHQRLRIRILLEGATCCSSPISAMGDSMEI